MTKEKKVTKQRKTKGMKKSTKPVSNYCRKVRLMPNKEVAGKLKQWFGCCRKTYNWALDAIKDKNREGDKAKINLIELRKRFVNAEAIPQDMKYLLECPKHVRDGAIGDLVEAFTTNFKKRAKNPDHKFEIKFRSRKDNQSIVIPGASLGDDQTIKMYPTFLKNRIRYQIRLRDKRFGKKVEEIEYDCRMLMDKLGRFYLCIPMVRGVGACDSQASPKLPWVALDPGVRTFQTLYSPEKGVAYKVGDGDMTRIFRLCKHLDKLISKAKNRKRFEKAIFRIRKRIKDLVDDVHWKAIAFLLSNFQNVLIPIFEVSRMVRKAERRIGRESVRKMLTWRHYVFRQRLMEKAKFTDSNVFVIGEEYTTKTCGNCFQLHHDIGGRKVFQCPHCNVRIDRDANASRNIFLKNVSLA
jgi:putative transposase